jgi:hypothetical protein
MAEHFCVEQQRHLRYPTESLDSRELIANVYKTIVQAISETSTVTAGTDATG